MYAHVPAGWPVPCADNQTIKTLTNMSQVTGKWWILKGLNCGQQGWPAAFDYFPCQRDEFVPAAGGTEGVTGSPPPAARSCMAGAAPFDGTQAT